MREASMSPGDGAPPRAPADGPGQPREPRAVEASQLMAGGRELIILHRGERYRLRVTQRDKLILTK